MATAQTGLAATGDVSVDMPMRPWRHPLLNERYHAAVATRLNCADQTAKGPRLSR
jgi:hypothetical protein